MLDSANEYQAAIDSLTSNKAMGMRKCELSEEEFGIAEELRDVLRVSHKHRPNPALTRVTVTMAYRSRSVLPTLTHSP